MQWEGQCCWGLFFSLRKCCFTNNPYLLKSLLTCKLIPGSFWTYLPLGCHINSQIPTSSAENQIWVLLTETCVCGKFLEMYAFGSQISYIFINIRVSWKWKLGIQTSCACWSVPTFPAIKWQTRVLQPTQGKVFCAMTWVHGVNQTVFSCCHCLSK